MRARIYVKDRLIGEVDVWDPLRFGQETVVVGDKVTVAFVGDREERERRPLFLSGRVERA